MSKPKVVHEWAEHGTQYALWLEGDIYTVMYYNKAGRGWMRCLLDQQALREIHRLVKRWGVDDESVERGLNNGGI